jgi:hypothetical protein
VSIDSLQSQHPFHRFASFSPRSALTNAGPAVPADPTAPAQGGFGPPAPASSVPTGSGSNQGTAATPANPFQVIAADIEAMLMQARGGAGQPAGGTGSSATPASGGTGSTATTAGTGSTPGTGTAVTEASLEQKLATDLQTLFGDLQAGSNANGDETGAVEHHHHHHEHHHHHDGGANGASSGGPGAAAAPSEQSLSRMAADIVRAFKAFSAPTGSSATASMTA